jgi:hypothetical protein
MISDINTSVGAERNGQPVLVTSVVCCYSVLQGYFAIFCEFSRKKLKFHSLWQIPLLGSKFRDPRGKLWVLHVTDMKLSASKC